MFDLTKNILLEGKWKKFYAFLRLVLYAVFLVMLFVFAYFFLFPSRYFYFFFQTPEAMKNTVLDPRFSDLDPVVKGRIEAGKDLGFDVSMSEITDGFNHVRLFLKKESDTLGTVAGKISVKKSYRSFFSPVGPPAGFKNGELVYHAGDYFIVSEEKLRKFISLKLLSGLGYEKADFREVAEEDLLYNGKGDDITDNNYTDGALFRVDDEYYRLSAGKLVKFVSEKAYLSQYEKNFALEKNRDFISGFDVSEISAGFQTGTPVSAGNSVYLINGNSLDPVGSEKIFTALGYDWNDVLPLSEHEIAGYDKNKLAGSGLKHPAGTIFFARDTLKYYYFDGREKREIKSPAIIKSYLRGSPVAVEEKSLGISPGCEIMKGSWLSGGFICEIQLNDIRHNLGNDYQFAIIPENNFQLSELEVKFIQDASWENFNATLSKIKEIFITKYGNST